MMLVISKRWDDANSLRATSLGIITACTPNYYVIFLRLFVFGSHYWMASSIIHTKCSQHLFTVIRIRTTIEKWTYIAVICLVKLYLAYSYAHSTWLSLTECFTFCWVQSKNPLRIFSSEFCSHRKNDWRMFTGCPTSITGNVWIPW